MMEFANPQFLVWLWLVPLVAVILVAAEKSRRRRIAAFAGARVAALRLLRGRSALKLGLRLFALTATILALAGPRWGFAWQNVKRQGADIMLAVDVSKSMLATDVDPDRLTRARRELVDLLGLLQGDRIGLVAFAGEAFVQCPLTEDYGAARMFIDLLTPDLIPVQGTDLGRAIDVAIKGLDDGSPSGSEGRAIVLITDGEDQEGRGKAAAERLKDSGVKLYTIGIGSAAGGPIPETGGGFKKDANGEVIMTKPDEPALQAMALASGGMYVRSVAGDMDLRRLYTEGIRAGVGQKEISSGREKLWFERYQWLLLLAFLALIIDQCVMDVRSTSSRPNRRGTAAASALGLLIAALGAAGFGRDAFAASGREAFESGDYPTAASEFQAEEVDNPDEPRHTYNRALSQFKAGQFGDAAQGFERAAALASEPRLKQDSWFNLGNARVGAGKLPEAKAAYEQALALDPGDRSSRENLEYVKKLLEEEQKQKEQQKQDQKQDQQQDKQDQQDQNEKQDQQQQDQQQQDQKDQQQNGGEGQKPDEQKSDEQKQQEEQQKQDEQAKQDQSQDGKNGEQSEQEQQAEQEKQAAEQQAEQEKQQAAQQAGQQSAGKEMKDMDQQEAERLLQSVEDQATKYHYRPEGGERGSEPKQSAKDW